MLYLTALNGWLVIQTIIFVIALLTGKLQMGFDGMKLQLITLYDIFISVYQPPSVQKLYTYLQEVSPPTKYICSKCFGNYLKYKIVTMLDLT